MIRIPLDPVPVVLGIYAHVGDLLKRAAAKREEGTSQALAKRISRQRQSADKDVQKLVRAMHTDVKTADKLLKKTGDVPAAFQRLIESPPEALSGRAVAP